MSLADFPTWHIRSPKVLRRLGHRKDGESVRWWKVCENNVDNDDDAIRQMDELGRKTYNNVVTEIDDVWQCLFGRAEHVQIPKNCSCNSNVSENGENHSSHVPNRDLESTIAGAIILHGEPAYLYLPLLIEGTYIPSL